MIASLALAMSSRLRGSRSWGLGLVGGVLGSGGGKSTEVR